MSTLDGQILVGTVVGNNEPDGTTKIETVAHVSLDVGTKIYARLQDHEIIDPKAEALKDYIDHQKGQP